MTMTDASPLLWWADVVGRVVLRDHAPEWFHSVSDTTFHLTA
jgi:hypothetical protein